MLLKDERNLIVEYGKKLITSGLTKGTGGNISIYNRKENLLAISPSGMEYFKTDPEDVVVVTLDGEIKEGNRKYSSELEMHSIFYKNREDISAIVHAHSPFATTLAALNWGLPAVSYLVAHAGPNVRCAKYASFGTKELAEHALEAMRDRKAVLLANHGLLAGSDNIASAFNIAEEIEFSCEIYYRAKSIGTPVVLSYEEIEHMVEKFKSYGQ